VSANQSLERARWAPAVRLRRIGIVPRRSAPDPLDRMAINSKLYAFAPDAEAEVTFLATAEGGRKSPVQNDYRPQFYYDGHDWDAVHEYPDVDAVNPGDTARVLLRFLSPQEHLGRVVPGLEFLIREGARTVARGRITKILALADSVARAQARRPRHAV
jgi:translation elongation factor EF-Tu-like GTPase